MSQGGLSDREPEGRSKKISHLTACLRASPVVSPKRLPNIFEELDIFSAQSHAQNAPSVRRGPIWCPTPRDCLRSTGNAPGAPDRARSETGSGGSDASLTHERYPTAANLATEVIGAQRRRSFHRDVTTRLVTPSSPCQR
jgi:hypothetical protein